MVAPLLAAAARGAAKSAAKSGARRAAKKAGSISSKSRKYGDDATIARKRYYRASERYLKQASQTTGATSAKYRQLARQAFDDALSTYDPANTQRYSKPIQKLAQEFGYDLERERRLPEEEGARNRELSRRARQQERLVSDRSGDILSETLSDPEKRRELEAKNLLRSSEIGRRIIGAYVDVWKEDATFTDPETGLEKVDTKKIFQIMFKYFNVDNVADLIEKVEDEVGESLYQMGNPDEIYETVKLTLTKSGLKNELVA